MDCVDSDVRFVSDDDLQVAGVLAWPYGADPVPGVVFIGGSGPSDRDNDGFFVPLRERLHHDGIAALSYDKRGVGGSEGRWESATVEDLAADAAAALAFLRRQPRVDPRRTSLFGHSEGGWVALRASLRTEPPARMVLNSCPGVSFLDAETFALKGAGLSAEDVSGVASLFRQLAEIAGAGQGVHAGHDCVASARGQAWFDVLGASGFELTDVLGSQLQAWGTYDPIPDLMRCTVSTIALFGADDPLVPVQASIENYDRTASLAGRDQVNRVFPRAGHRMAVPDSNETVPGYLEYLSNLLRLDR